MAGRIAKGIAGAMTRVGTFIEKKPVLLAPKSFPDLKDKHVTGTMMTTSMTNSKKAMTTMASFLDQKKPELLESKSAPALKEVFEEVIKEVSSMATEAMMDKVKKWLYGDEFIGKPTESYFHMVGKVPGFDTGDLLVRINSKWVYVEGETNKALSGYKKCEQHYKIPKKVVFHPEMCTAEVLYGEVMVNLPLSDAANCKDQGWNVCKYLMFL